MLLITTSSRIRARRMFYHQKGKKVKYENVLAHFVAQKTSPDPATLNLLNPSDSLSPRRRLGGTTSLVKVPRNHQHDYVTSTGELREGADFKFTLTFGNRQFLTHGF